MWYAKFLLRLISTLKNDVNIENNNKKIKKKILEKIDIDDKEKNKKFCLTSLKTNQKNNKENNIDWKIVDYIDDIFLYVGKPGVMAGHVTDASSYFDRLLFLFFVLFVVFSFF